MQRHRASWEHQAGDHFSGGIESCDVNVVVFRCQFGRVELEAERGSQQLLTQLHCRIVFGAEMWDLAEFGLGRRGGHGLKTGKTGQ